MNKIGNKLYVMFNGFLLIVGLYWGYVAYGVVGALIGTFLAPLFGDLLLYVYVKKTHNK